MFSSTRSLAQRASSALLLAVVSILASGCAGMSGLGGSSEFNCSAPTGVPCRSVTGVHINERNGTLPNQSAALARAPKSYSSEPASAGEGGGPSMATAPAARHYKAAAYTPGQGPGAAAPQASQAPLGAIRSDPTVIRIWIAPWEDADGDLNDQGYVYLQIDSGRWLVEHNRERIRREFAPRTSTAAVGPMPGQGAATTTATAGERPRPAASGKGDAPVDAEELAAAIARGQAMAAKRKAQAGAEDAGSGAGGEARP
jgi:conjugal transfer pilus assembly protein TraV